MSGGQDNTEREIYLDILIESISVFCRIIRDISGCHREAISNKWNEKFLVVNVPSKSIINGVPIRSYSFFQHYLRSDQDQFLKVEQQVRIDAYQISNASLAMPYTNKLPDQERILSSGQCGKKSH